jgi:putative ABC transport system permease protein
MPRLGRFARELRARLWKPSVDEEVRREIENHLHLLEHDLIAGGLDPAAARASAKARFGDADRIGEACREIGELRDRDARRAEWLAELRQDVRYALRQMRANRRFTVVALLTLAVGLGASTTIFGIANAVLLRPFPVADADRLILINGTTPNGSIFSVSEPDFLDLRARARTLAGIAAFGQRSMGLRTDDGVEQLVGAAATHSLFGVLGVAPVQGRTHSAAEDDPRGDRRVVVLSHALWTRRFGAESTVLSRSIELDGVMHRIIGVMPDGFDFPGRTDLWLPLAPNPAYHRGDRRLDLVARLAPGVTPTQATAEVESIAQQLATEYPDANAGWGAQVRPFAEWYVSPELRTRVYTLLATVGVLLLMACVNVASLLLARAGAREREVAVRSALGAGRGRIVRQLLTEGVVLSVAGAVAGVALAAAVTPMVRSIGSAAIPRLEGLALDWRVISFAVGACLTTGILFGLAPGLHLARGRGGNSDAVLGVLRSGSRAIGSGRLGNTLVVTSVALAMLLLVSAGLVGGSFLKLMRVTLGFSPEHVMTASIALSGGDGSFSERAVSFYSEVERRVQGIPGVRAAGSTNIAPFSGGNTAMGFEPAEAAPQREGDYRMAGWRIVTPGFFQALGIPLIRGRLFDTGDRDPSALVALINETMARRIWPGVDPLGRRLSMGSGRIATIVGVVGDTRHVFADSVPPPTVYLAHTQFPWRAMWLTVRSTGDPMALVASVRRELAAVDPGTSMARVQPLTQLLKDTTAEPRLTVLVFSIFALAALVLAAIGLYGIVSYTVAQRTREIGVRLALGAPPRRILGGVLDRGVRLALLGVVIGGVAGYGAAGALRTILFETEPTDVATFLGIAVLMLAVACLASAVPARRAARTDPLVALRSE